MTLPWDGGSDATQSPAPLPAWPPPPAPPPAAPHPRLVPAVAVLCGLALAGGVVAVVARQGDDSYPDEWDPRVLELVEFVEEQRNLSFEHPVHVDFLTADEYADVTRSEDTDLTDDGLAELDDLESFLRALGMVQGDLDLLDAFNELTDSGTLAFYDPVDERVTARGTEMTTDLEVTLVHELTHVAQDQAFDIERLQRSDSAGGFVAVRALLEGDAIRIEERYVQTLSPEERQSYDAARTATTAGAEAALADVPPIVFASFQAPYEFGVPFVRALEADDGDAAINDAFDEPPASEEHLVDATRYFAGDGVRTIESPDLPDGADELDRGQLGSVGWFLLLAERIDAQEALTAIDGWGGDEYLLYREDDATCVQATFEGDSSGDVDEMAAAVDAWAAALPAGMVTIEPSDVRVSFVSCDPGPEADLGVTGLSVEALALPIVRAHLLAGALHEFDGDLAFCVADTTARSFSLAELADPSAAIVQDGRLEEAGQQAGRDCGAT